MALCSGQKTLLVAGATLFLLGLFQGAAVQLFANPRMALSAHLTAVQSGTAMIVAGLVWPALALPRRAASIARWAIIGGMTGLWIGLTAAAAAGASRGLPIAGAGHSAGASTEQMVTLIIGLSSGALTLGWAMLLIGLIRAGRAATLAP